MRLTIEGRGTRTRRTISFTDDIDQVNLGNGYFKGGFAVGVGIECFGSPVAAKCRVNDPGSVGFWAAEGETVHHRFSLYSQVPGSLGADKVAWNLTAPIVYGEGIYQYGSYLRYRCDSATYVGRYGRACTFAALPGLLTYRRSDWRVNEVAKNIWDAYNRPEATKPTNPNKYIPDYITRLRPGSKQIGANQRKAVKTCKAIDRNYAKKNRDCDEFPFESTSEGAAGAGIGTNYSARPVWRPDNRRAGGIYGAWLTTDHNIAGDSFGVDTPP